MYDHVVAFQPNSIDAYLRTVGRYQGPKNLDGWIDARVTWTKIDHLVRHRWKDALVTVLTYESPTADIIGTQQPPLVVCVVIWWPKQEGVGRHRNFLRVSRFRVHVTSQKPVVQRVFMRHSPQEACNRFKKPQCDWLSWASAANLGLACRRK